MIFRIRLISVLWKITFVNSADSPNSPFTTFTFSLSPSPFHFHLHFFTFTFSLLSNVTFDLLTFWPFDLFGIFHLFFQPVFHLLFLLLASHLLSSQLFPFFNLFFWLFSFVFRVPALKSKRKSRVFGKISLIMQNKWKNVWWSWRNSVPL